MDLELGRELGRGGSAVVYAARLRGHDVALKILHPELALSEADRTRFLREAESLAAVDHDGVIRIVEVGILDDGRPFLAMELVAGETLAERVERCPLERDEALRRFQEVAGALRAIHEAGLLHRDIKPENVLCTPERTVLLDLGIAKPTDPGQVATSTCTGVVRGTPDYMAPERLFGVEATISSDVYELGLLLYIMLAGRAPWDDATDPSARHDPRPIADPADAAIRRALSVSAKTRPPTVAELVDDVLAGHVPASRRVTRDSDATHPPPTRRAWLPWLATVAATLAVVVSNASVLEPPLARAQERHAQSIVATAAAAPETLPAIADAVKPSGTLPPRVVSPPRSGVAATAPLAGTSSKRALLLGPNCQRYLHLRCSPEATARMKSTEPCRVARQSLRQTAAALPPQKQEDMCGKLNAVRH